MVLSRLTADEIERVKSAGREGLDYEERLEDILDRPVEEKLSQYGEELREKEPSREEYINRLEVILM